MCIILILSENIALAEVGGTRERLLASFEAAEWWRFEAIWIQIWIIASIKQHTI